MHTIYIYVASGLTELKMDHITVCFVKGVALSDEPTDHNSAAERFSIFQLFVLVIRAATLPF